MHLSAFRSLQEYDSSFGAPRQYKRHPFHATLAKRFIVAETFCDDEPSEQVMRLVDQQARSLQGSQCEEDKFKVQKVARQLRGTVSRKKPAVAFASAISEKVLDVRHHYKAVPIEAVGIQTGMVLGKDAFDAKLEDMTKQPPDIVSTSQSCSWWTPAAFNLNCPLADLYM